MSNLIEKDALKRKHCDTCECKSNCMGTGCKIYEARCLIADLPTIDAEPVKHGRWIQSEALDYKDPNGVIHVHGMCSCCKLIYDFRDMTSRFKFCPNCGAKMDGGEEDAGTD